MSNNYLNYNIFLIKSLLLITKVIKKNFFKHFEPYIIENKWVNTSGSEMIERDHNY